MEDLFHFDIDMDELIQVFAPMHEIQKAYPDIVYTERLIIKKACVCDIVSTVYTLHLKSSSTEIGSVTMISDGEIWYKVYPPFVNKGYATEAVSKLIEVSKAKEFNLSIDPNNLASQKVATKLGFTPIGRTTKNLIFKKTK